jgi:hypothetical protein
VRVESKRLLMSVQEAPDPGRDAAEAEAARWLEVRRKPPTSAWLYWYTGILGVACSE